MSQNVYYTEWLSDQNYRLELYGASTDELTSPNYIELPEDVIVVEKYNVEFDKYPIGLAKAPVLKFRVKLSKAINLPAEFIELFTKPLKPIDYSNISSISKIVYAGTVVRLLVGDNLEYMVGIIRNDTDIDIDMVAGEISVEAVHWIKVALDAIDFSMYAAFIQVNGYIEYTDKGIIEYEYLNQNGLRRIYKQDRKKTLFGMSKMYRIFEYIQFYLGILKRTLLRTSYSMVWVPYADIRYYRQDGNNVLGIGAPIDINEVYVIAMITNIDRSRIYGGIAYDPDGLRRYKSAWDFLADYYEYTLSRAYISTRNNIAVRMPCGSYGIDQATIGIECEELYSCKITMNYMPLTTVVGSSIETVGDDVGKYENARAGSRNVGEYTLPIVFGNVPPAIEYSKVSKTTWVGFAPHIYGVYYKDGNQYRKCHHYVDVPISRNKRSSMYTECQYNVGEINATQLMEQFEDNHKIAMIMIQRVSGAGRWISAALRRLYDRAGQQMLRIELPASAINCEDMFENYYTINMGTDGSMFGVSGRKYIPVAYEIDYLSEKSDVSLIDVDSNAI